MHADARAVLDALGLKPHPEGGFFLETFRSAETLDAVRAPGAPGGPGSGGSRAASTAIYFLLPAGAISAWHRVRSDEVWHFYAGDPLELQVIDASGRAARHVLGVDLARGERPQAVVAAGEHQAARCLGDRFTLCGCTVAPGFDFADFEMPTLEQMLERFPEREETVRRFAK
jgi:predicted cupin superfamily sugar epimerase